MVDTADRTANIAGSIVLYLFYPFLHFFPQIGSGFDVCSASYGSVRYLRVPPPAMEGAMEAVKSALKEPSTSAAADAVPADKRGEAGAVKSGASAGVSPAWAVAGRMLCALGDASQASALLKELERSSSDSENSNAGSGSSEINSDNDNVSRGGVEPAFVSAVKAAVGEWKLDVVRYHTHFLSLLVVYFWYPDDALSLLSRKPLILTTTPPFSLAPFRRPHSASPPTSPCCWATCAAGPRRHPW